MEGESVMTAEACVEACRTRLVSETPLKTDCGMHCGARCCQSMDGEETGMLLFPGEAARYAGNADYQIVQNGTRTLLICQGHCDRKDRPLSCMLFPLLPQIQNDIVRVRMDERARGVCPLYDSGVYGVSESFAESVRACGEMLGADPVCREMLEQLQEEQRELRQMRKIFQRGKNV